MIGRDARALPIRILSALQRGPSDLSGLCAALGSAAGSISCTLTVLKRAGYTGDDGKKRCRVYHFIRMPDGTAPTHRELQVQTAQAGGPTILGGNAGIVLRAIWRRPMTASELVSYTGLSINTVGGQISYLTNRNLINICGRLPGVKRSASIRYGIPGRDAVVSFVQAEEDDSELKRARRSRDCGSGQIAGPTYARGLGGWGGWR